MSKFCISIFIVEVKRAIFTQDNKTYKIVCYNNHSGQPELEAKTQLSMLTLTNPWRTSLLEAITTHII